MPATRGVQRFTLGGLTASCIAAEQLRQAGARTVGSAAARTDLGKTADDPGETEKQRNARP